MRQTQWPSSLLSVKMFALRLVEKNAVILMHDCRSRVDLVPWNSGTGSVSKVRFPAGFEKGIPLALQAGRVKRQSCLQTGLLNKLLP